MPSQDTPAADRWMTDAEAAEVEAHAAARIAAEDKAAADMAAVHAAIRAARGGR